MEGCGSRARAGWGTWETACEPLGAENLYVVHGSAGPCRGPSWARARGLDPGHCSRAGLWVLVTRPHAPDIRLTVSPQSHEFLRRGAGPAPS